MLAQNQNLYNYRQQLQLRMIAQLLCYLLQFLIFKQTYYNQYFLQIYMAFYKTRNNNQRQRRYYCYHCRNFDGKHLARDCPNYNNQKQLMFTNTDKKQHCRVSNCPQNHRNHYCRVCRDRNSSHFARDCYLSNNINTYIPKNSFGDSKYREYSSSGNHTYLAYKLNHKQDHKNFINNYKDNDRPQTNDSARGFQNQYNMTDQGFKRSLQIGCKVQGCKQNHRRHYCCVCKDNDSSHFSRNCSKDKPDYLGGFNEKLGKNREVRPNQTYKISKEGQLSKEASLAWQDAKDRFKKYQKEIGVVDQNGRRKDFDKSYKEFNQLQQEKNRSHVSRL